MRDTLTAIAQAKLKLVVSKVFPFAAMRDGDFFGKIVADVAGA